MCNVLRVSVGFVCFLGLGFCYFLEALCFLFLQVESLTAARSAFKAGTEPSDAIRVVNAVLMQIDQIKR